jgi:hypothetical protein
MRDAREIIRLKASSPVDDRHVPAPLSAWHEVIGDPTYADAILDRLVHNAHRIELTGESLRRARGKQSKTALPETTPAQETVSANKRGAPGAIISLQGGGIIQESLGAIIPL